MVLQTALVTLGAAACASRPKRDPDQSLALYQLGVDNYRNRRVEAAIEELGKALKADPENAEAHNLLGIITLNQGHDYVMQVEGAGCLKGRDAEMVREDAVRKFREAETHFRRALALRPSFSEASNNLAATLLQLQDWDGAIGAASEALKDATYTQPEFARANLGWAYFHKKDLQRAWKELHEAASRAPGFCVGRYRLAKVYVERGDMDEAAQEADAVVADPRCPIQEAFLLAGLVHQRRKNPERAKALFDRCSTMAPKSCVADECRRYAQLVQ
jgi:Tfp pilus assembly protein PilF